MRFKQRPSFRELFNKLAQAKIALDQKKYFFGPSIDKLVDEFMFLNIDNADEIWPLLTEILPEIKPENYAGPHPPMRSIEMGVNSELYIFVWESKKMQKEMYLKFAIKEDHFCFVSLHKSNRPEKCWRFVNSSQSYPSIS